MSKTTFTGYVPSLKEKHEATIVEGKAIESKGGSIRYTLRGEYEGRKTLPKTVSKADFENVYGFDAKGAEMVLNADTVGEPSPASVEPPAPSEKPFPQEPTNEHFEAFGLFEDKEEEAEPEAEKPKEQEFTVIMQEGDKLELTDIEETEGGGKGEKDGDNDGDSENDEKEAELLKHTLMICPACDETIPDDESCIECGTRLRMGSEYEAVQAKVTRPAKEEPKEEDEEDEEGMSTLAKVGLGVGALAIGAAVLSAEDEGELDYWAGENAHWRVEGEDFQKMTPSEYVPFDQMQEELGQMWDETTAPLADAHNYDYEPSNEPSNSNFSAEFGVVLHRDALETADIPDHIEGDDEEDVREKVHDMMEEGEWGDYGENLDWEVTQSDSPSIESIYPMDDFSAEFEARTTRKSIHNPITDESQYDNPTGKMIITPDGKGDSGHYERDKRKRKGHKRISNPKKMDWDNQYLGQNFIQTKQREKEDLRDFKRHGMAETVGSPSPSGPSSIPEPAEATGSEPSNEHMEADSNNTKMMLGITALGIGIAAVLGKDKLSKLFDRFGL